VGGRTPIGPVRWTVARFRAGHEAVPAPPTATRALPARLSRHGSACYPVRAIAPFPRRPHPAVTRPSEENTVGYAPDEVHVWWIAPGAAGQPTAARAHLLSGDERARAGRLRTLELSHDFVAARAARREILARYLGARPERIEFVRAAGGKPAVAGGGDLRFSASDTRGAALLAVAHGREVGIDVERARPLHDALELARRFLSPAEQRVLAGVEGPEREATFLRCWTRKEAFVKALGTGLAHPLDAFDVACGPGEEARLLADRADPDAIDRWRLISLEDGPEWFAALVVEGTGWVLRRFEWASPGCQE
jgi:4'-phosphopantetheinyl transferase